MAPVSGLVAVSVTDFLIANFFVTSFGLIALEVDGDLTGGLSSNFRFNANFLVPVWAV